MIQVQQPAPHQFIDPRNGRKTKARLCPSCIRRWDMIPIDDCLLCQGAGLMVLGATVVETRGADVASLAVEMALEKAARFAMSAPHINFSLARFRLTETVARMRRVGLLASLPDEVGRAGKLTVRSQTAQTAYLVSATRSDQRDGVSEQVEWQPPDLPRSSADTPGFEVATFLCHLLRVRSAHQEMNEPAAPSLF